MTRRNSTVRKKRSKANGEKDVRALFGNNPEPLRQLVKQMYQQISETELSQYLISISHFAGARRNNTHSHYRTIIIS
ncbi:MAG: hypothetical protein WDA18_05710 [Candidatus Ratteibacteria bacterium]